MQFPFFGKKSSEAKTFFGLFLKEKEGIGMVLKLTDAKISLMSEQKFSYSNGWENIAEDIDQLILKLEQQTHVHLHETIFFVYSHFIDEKTKEIKKPYFQKIKDLVKKLDLKALGYIECYEAVVTYLQEKEELPIPPVLIELDSSNLTLLIYKRGQLSYSKILAHTDSIIDDLLTAFNEIKGKFLLPSRIILYNSKDLDDESTQIVTYRWSEELFIQLPRVEIIKEHEVIQGLLTVFGEQFGKQKPNIELVENKPPEEVLGFVIGDDVAEQEPPVSSETTSPPPPVFTDVEDGSKDKGTDERLSTEDFHSDEAKSPRGACIFKNMESLPQFLTKKAIIFVGLAIILLALFLNEYFLHTSTLTLFLPSQTITKEVTLNYPGDIDIQKTVKSADLSDKKSTTGKKDIGEKAKGSITVHNFDDKEKAFSKGTILESGNLRFILDQDIKVASSSVVTVSGGLVKQPGKTKASVTAEDNGPQGNLSSGKQFKIDDFSTSLYFGLNESAFAGGTKKEVKTVSKKDIEDLKTSLLAKAKKAKLDQLADEKGSDTHILSKLTEVTLQNEKYSKEIGEEADSLSLTAKANATLYLYKNKDLSDHLHDILVKDAPSDFTLEKNKINFTVDNANKKDDKISLSVSANGKFIKDVKSSDVLKTVKGKSIENVKKMMKDNYKANSIQLDIEPKLPILENFMPFFEKNIIVKISSS